MVQKMIDWIHAKPNSKEFTDFFGTSGGAQTAVLNRLQAILDMEQLNVYLTNDGQSEAAHAVFSGGVTGLGGMGDSLNLMGINIAARNDFFNMPAYPKTMILGHFVTDLPTAIKSQQSAAGNIIHEVSHMFGTEDVSGEFVNRNGLSGTCYGRQNCLDLAAGVNVQNPTGAPYNNTDSYQFFANEVYLYDDLQVQEANMIHQVEQRYHVTVNPPTHTTHPLVAVNDPLIGLLRDLMQYDPEGAKKIMESVGLKESDIK